MGEVVQLSEFRRAPDKQVSQVAPAASDGLIPIEFAVGFSEREQCLQKIAQYGVRAIHVRSVHNRPEALLYFIAVEDAIWLNKKILELEEISDEEVAQRIDLIQLMENMDLALLDSLWASFTRCDSLSEA